jgi:hypothetical protein
VLCASARRDVWCDQDRSEKDEPWQASAFIYGLVVTRGIWRLDSVG